jgi:aminoglycoside/choline kinase family phosphotransferase
MTSERSAAIDAFLSASGWSGAQRMPLPGDASTRRYERLRLGARQTMLMDAPRGNEDAPCPPGASEAERIALGWNATSRLAASRVEAFAAVSAHLRGLGLSAPEVLAVDPALGLAIVEDLGDTLFARAIPEGANEIVLYEAAALLLAELHAAPMPDSLPAPGGEWPLLAFDRLALSANADLFVDWLPRLEPSAALAPADRRGWEAVRDGLVQEALTFPRAFTLRDYHAENLLWLPGRTGAARVGLLDFQDAVQGFRAWDFAMLLQDARRDVSPRAADAAIFAYLDATGASEAAFRREYAVLGAINALRILGIFSRLVARDGKERYRAFMPREWGHLAACLAHPAARDLAAFLRAAGAAPERFAA